MEGTGLGKRPGPLLLTQEELARGGERQRELAAFDTVQTAGRRVPSPGVREGATESRARRSSPFFLADRAGGPAGGGAGGFPPSCEPGTGPSPGAGRRARAADCGARAGRPSTNAPGGALATERALSNWAAGGARGRRQRGTQWPRPRPFGLPRRGHCAR